MLNEYNPREPYKNCVNGGDRLAKIGIKQLKGINPIIAMGKLQDELDQFLLDNPIVKELLIKNKQLQAKIDKANEILKKYKHTKVDNEDGIIMFYAEMKQILKEGNDK